MDMGIPATPNPGPATHNPGRHITIAPTARKTGNPDIVVHVQTLDELTTPQLREKFMALKRELQRTEFELVLVWKHCLTAVGGSLRNWLPPMGVEWTPEEFDTVRVLMQGSEELEDAEPIPIVVPG